MHDFQQKLKENRIFNIKDKKIKIS